MHTGTPLPQVQEPIIVSASRRLDLGIGKTQYQYWRGVNGFVDPDNIAAGINPADASNFPDYFWKAYRNSEGIDFDLKGIDRQWLERMFRQGNKIIPPPEEFGQQIYDPNYTGKGWTAWELFTILTHKALLNDTTFYLRGRRLTSEEATQFWLDVANAADDADVDYRLP
jgi:Fe-S cluster biosynthesis and repair protein YggX